MAKKKIYEENKLPDKFGFVICNIDNQYFKYINASRST